MKVKMRVSRRRTSMDDEENSDDTAVDEGEVGET